MSRNCWEQKRSKNKSFSKNELVTDYYDPTKPSANIDIKEINRLKAKQQTMYDEARFKELMSRVEELERQRKMLLKLRIEDK